MDTKRTIIMIGRIGSGKSTLLNKLNTAIDILNGVPEDQAIKIKKFKAKVLFLRSPSLIAFP